MLAMYVPLGYYIDRFMYRRRQRQLQAARAAKREQEVSERMDVRCFTVGQVAENCYVVRRDGADRGLIVDPGEEAERILGAVDELGIGIDAILLTHTHFDHIGAVAPVAKATGAPVYCPEIEVPVLADIMSYVPWPGFGPYESYDADETVAGGERLELAGLEIDVIFTPGHSPGHVTYAIRDEPALFSGDVLFEGSVGRVDLPGGDWPTLLESIRGWSTTSRGDGRLPGPHGDDDARRRARLEPVLGRARRLSAATPGASAGGAPAPGCRRAARRPPGRWPRR